MLIFSALRTKSNAFAVTVSVLTVVLNVLICLGTKSEALLHAAPVLLFLCLFALILLGRRNIGKLLFFLLSAPVVILPLTVTAEIGPRLYFMPYIFILAMTVCAIPPLGKSKRTVSATFIVAVGLILCMVFYARIYVEIRSVTVARAEAVVSAVSNGDSQVIMKKDTNVYWWGRNCGEERMTFFKKFYGIPENIEVVFEK